MEKSRHNGRHGLVGELNGNEELKALRRNDDVWVLIVEELVRVGSNYYRPHRTQILGPREILNTVARLGSSDLRGAAELAMSGTHSSYRISGGRLEAWHSKSRARVRPPRNEAAPESGALQSQVKTLEHRVRKIEAMLRNGIARTKQQSRVNKDTADSQSNDSPSSRKGKAPVKSSTGPNEASPDANEPSAKEPSAGASDAAKENVSPDPHSPVDAARSPSWSEPSPSPGLAAAPEAEDGVPVAADAILTFPTCAEYAKGITTLLDEDIALEEDASSPDVRAGVYFMTPLIGREEEVIGAIVVDLKAVVSQGGTLIMLGESALDEMVESASPSDDVIDAMKEVVNVQSRCFNDVEGNPHVRIGEFRKVEPTDDWLSTTAHRLTLLDRFGGRTLLLSK